MKKLISLTLALILIVACLSGVVFADDPIATITNGSKTVEVSTLSWEQNEDLKTLIAADGTSVVTLLKDFSTTEVGIYLPYSCTIDLNGHTLTSGRNGIWIQAAGSANSVTTVKNGTINCLGSVGIRIDGGSAVVDNVVSLGSGAAGFGIYSTEGTSYLRNSTFVSKKYFAVSFNHADADQSACNIDIANCDLITIFDNYFVLGVRGKQGGTFILGNNVNLYTYKVDSCTGPKASYAGEKPAPVNGVHNIEVPEIKETFYSLCKFATPESSIVPEIPVTPAKPTIPSTPVPDVEVPKTGVTVAALSILAAVSMAGAVMTSRKEN